MPELAQKYKTGKNNLQIFLSEVTFLRTALNESLRNARMLRDTMALKGVLVQSGTIYTKVNTMAHCIR